MSMMMRFPESSDALLELSAALGGFVNRYDLAPERDIVVHCFDTSVNDWDKLPAAWHRPMFGDVVVNLGTVLKSLCTRAESPEVREFVRGSLKTGFIPSPDLIHRTALSIRTATRAAPGAKYETFSWTETFNSSTVVNTHRALREEVSIHKDRLSRGSADASLRIASTALRNTLIAIILHETGHSVFSDYITSQWYGRLNPYKRQVMTMFEELRAERQQLRRIGAGTALIRHAADVVVDPKRIASDIVENRAKGGKLNVANLALNSTLCLGRAGYHVFRDHEVRGLRNLVTDTVGDARYAEMVRVWDEFSDIREIDPDAMTQAVNEWVELFPSAKDGSGVSSSIVIKLPKPPKRPEDDDDEPNEPEESDDDGLGIKFVYEDDEAEGGDGMAGDDVDPEGMDGKGSDEGEDEGEDEEDDTSGSGDGDESDGIDGEAEPEGGEGVKGVGDEDGEEELDLPGFADDIADAMDESTDAAVRFPHDTNDEYGPADRKPIRVSFATAETHTRTRNRAIALLEPMREDRTMAKQLAQDLASLNLTDRGKFKVSSVTPPGRLRTRAMVQRAADKSAGRISQAQPWSRYKRTVDLNPPLTVGIMTDTSSSQAWSTEFSSRVAWIISHAVSEINGRSAAVTFGQEVLITMRPGEQTDKRKSVTADGGTELFDIGAGTLDTMLNLSNGTGTRILFVATDGYLVEDDGLEMRKAAEWVKKLKASGCVVVWITPTDAVRGSAYGLRCVPDGVALLPVDKRIARSNPSSVITQITNVIKREIASHRRH